MPMENGDKKKGKDKAKKPDGDDETQKALKESMDKRFLNGKHPGKTDIPTKEFGFFLGPKTSSTEQRTVPDGIESVISVGEEEENPNNFNIAPVKTTQKVCADKLPEIGLKEKANASTALQKVLETVILDPHGLLGKSTVSLDQQNIADIKEAFREVLDGRAQGTSCGSHLHELATTTSGATPIPCSGDPRPSGGECRCCFIDCTCKCHSRNLKGYHKSQCKRRARKRKRRGNIKSSEEPGDAYPLKKNISDSGSDNTIIDSESEVMSNVDPSRTEFMAEMKWLKSSASRRKGGTSTKKPHKDSPSSSSDESDSDRIPSKDPVTDRWSIPATDHRAKFPFNDLSSENDRQPHHEKKDATNNTPHDNEQLTRPDSLHDPFGTGALESCRKNVSQGTFALGMTQSSNKKQLESRHRADIPEPSEKQDRPVTFSLGKIQSPNNEQLEVREQACIRDPPLKSDMNVSFSLDISEKADDSTVTRDEEADEGKYSEPGSQSLAATMFESGYQSDGQIPDEDDVTALDEGDTSVRAEAQPDHVLVVEEDTQLSNIDTTIEMENTLEVSTVEERQETTEGPTNTWADMLSGSDDLDESELTDLLHTGVLPKQTDLQRAFELHRDGRLSTTIFDAICNGVCQHIQTMSDKICFVTTCYTAQTPEQVVFVALADQDVHIDTVYSVKICHPQGYSKEGTVITYHDIRKTKGITLEESEQITTTIQDHTEDLFKNHSNIQMISGCSVKSREFGTDHPVIDLQTCIVIYVNVKGAIPMHEQPFPRQLRVPGTTRSLPVDVREGGVHSFNKPLPKEYHTNLKMGCQITDKENTGTLGPILEYNTKPCCITCAHVFFNNPNEHFIDIMKAPDGVYTRTYDGGDIFVYQSSTDKPFGVVEHAAFLSGNKRYAGVDMAVIEITDQSRLPKEGSFPAGNMDAAGFDDENPMLYNSGKVYDEEEFRRQTRHHNEVVKYGCETEYTKGVFDVQGLVVKRIEFPAKDNIFSRTMYTMYNQMAVLAIGDPELNPFADEGDSGALVFAKHGGHWNDLRAVGIIEGGTSNKMVIVTPIWDIFRHLKKDTREGLAKFDGPPLLRIDSGYCSPNGALASPGAASGVDIKDQERSQELAGHFREVRDTRQREMKELEDRLNSKLDNINEATKRMQKQQTHHIQNLHRQQKQQMELVQQQNKTVSDLKQQQEYFKQQQEDFKDDLKQQQEHHSIEITNKVDSMAEMMKTMMQMMGQKKDD